MVQGLRPSCSVNNWSIALTAPSPSNTAPKAKAARITHMNMHEIPSVLRVAVSNTFHVKRRFTAAARTVVPTPMTELSTRLVQPLMKGIIIAAKIAKGKSPDFRVDIFSAQVISARSSAESGGARWGCKALRMPI